MSGENMSAGTIKLTNGSTAVVGTSTTFTVDLKSGDVITTTIGGVFYTLFVDTVTSATAATITDAFTGPTTTGAAYVAVPQMTLNRITAALAAQTAEAVRRVLQENANWQAFYSGSGDIIVTLPNGTPTGVQIPGPSWAKMQSTIGNPIQFRGEIPGGNPNINNYGPTDAYVGVWGKNTSGDATIANGYPEDGAVGMLEVFKANQYQGMQRYSIRGGKEYVRNLTGNWNASNPLWTQWYDVSLNSMKAKSLATGTDINAMLNETDLGFYRNGSGTTAALGWPHDGFNGTLEIVRGYGTPMQQIAIGSTGQMYMRYTSNATTWTKWYQVGTTVRPGTFRADLNSITDPGLYVVGYTAGTSLNFPANIGGFVQNIATDDGTAIYQNFIPVSTSSSYSGRKYFRIYASGAWTNWSEEVSDTTLLGLMGNISGIGNATSPLVTAFDWQQADFVTGVLQSFIFSSSVNAPSGITYTAGTTVTVQTMQARGTLFVVKMTPLTSATSNMREYTIVISGGKGSRTFPVVAETYNSVSGTPVSLSNGGTGAVTAAAARTNLGLKGAAILDVGSAAGTVAAGNDSRITGALQSTGGNITGSFVLNAAGAYLSNTAAARYTSGSVTYLDIWRFTQVDIGGVGTQGNLQFVANPGNYLSFELAPGNGSHSFRHDGKIVTNAGTVAFQSSDGRIKNKKGKPGGSPINRVRGLAKSATQDYLWLNYQGDFNTYRYEQPQRGFIAQDAWEVDPAYASKPQNGADDEMPDNGDAIWGVNTNAIVADVVLAVDAQQTDIEGLRQTVAEQQSQIAQLTSAIEQLSQQIQALSQADAQS